MGGDGQIPCFSCSDGAIEGLFDHKLWDFCRYVGSFRSHF